MRRQMTCGSLGLCRSHCAHTHALELTLGFWALRPCLSHVSAPGTCGENCGCTLWAEAPPEFLGMGGAVLSTKLWPAHACRMRCRRVYSSPASPRPPPGSSLGTDCDPLCIVCHSSGCGEDQAVVVPKPPHHLLGPLPCTYWFVLGAAAGQGCGVTSVPVPIPGCAGCTRSVGGLAEGGRGRGTKHRRHVAVAWPVHYITRSDHVLSQSLSAALQLPSLHP